jgi:hypothetical protein
LRRVGTFGEVFRHLACGGLRRVGWVFFGEQVQQFGPDHFFEHACRQWVGRVVVANVNVQPVHHIEVRVGEEFLHGGVAHLARHALAHEGLKIRRRREALHVGHGGQGRLRSVGRQGGLGIGRAGLRWVRRLLFGPKHRRRCSRCRRNRSHGL